MIRVKTSNEHSMDFLFRKMRNLKKSHKPDADDSSPINRLPDEIILEILNKLIDLKTLCFCYLVSRRFSSIVLQVGAISFTASSLSPRIPDKNTVGDVETWSSLYGESFQSVTRFLSKFKGVNSLCIELPSSSHRAIDNHCLFKWKVNIGHTMESWIFLWPTSVCDKDESYVNGNGLEEEDNQELVTCCLMDVFVWHRRLLNIVKNLSKLEEVSITDSGRRGRLSLSGEKLNEVKEWVNSASESEMDDVEIPYIWSHCKIPVLKLPVSGYVMKGIFFAVLEMKDLQGGNDFLKKSENGFEGKEEAAFTEAMMEILEKHRGMMRTYSDEVLL